MASPSDVLKMIADNDVKFVDLRFTDTRGKEQHVSVPTREFDTSKFEDGHAFDGSSISGWKGIQASDMLLMPDPESARIDPFTDEPVLNISCDVIEPADGKGYDRDPRSIAKRAEAYMTASGFGDTAYFGPEPEFFVFDSITWDVGAGGSFVKINSEEAPWSSSLEMEGGNYGHRPRTKGGYFPVPPVDSLQDLRNAICLALEAQGVEVEVHHHEVAAAGQCEIGTKFNTLVKRADWTQILKYTIWNTAHSYGKTATFMPKPVVGDNGTGMHVHQSIWKDGKNLTKVKTTKKQKNKKTGETRNVTKTVKQESFFNIFTSFDVPKQDSDEEEDEPDKETKELFEQVGECCQIIEALHTMHDDPLSYYMGFGPSLEDLMAGQEGFEDVDGGSDSDEAPALVKGKK